MFNLTPQQLVFFAILLTAITVLLTEKVRNDIIALLVVLALYLTGILSSQSALSGFGSEPAIVVASVFVISAGLHQTGLSDLIGSRIGALAGNSYSRAIAVIMPAVALMSAFTHHVTTTAMMMPVTLNLARERNIPASKLLMPLSFAASLGTTITIIGAPAFLIASESLQRAGRPPLGIFSIAPIGLAITIAGTIFMLIAGRYLLPTHPGGADATARYRLDDYFTEVLFPADSPFLGKTLDEITADGNRNLNVVGWVRRGRHLIQPFGHRQIVEGDVLLVKTTPEELATIRQESGIELRPVERYTPKSGNGSEKEDAASQQLVQMIVAPSSYLIGRTIGNSDFRRRYGVIVVSIWRQHGFLDQQLAKISLREGDVLVVEGDEDALSRLANDPAFLMMVPFQGEGQSRHKVRWAAAIMLGTVVLAASGLVTLEMATLAGAVAMVLMRCLTTRQAYRAIDYRIYVFIAGTIPLGTAMDTTGASKILASWLQFAVQGWNQVIVLLALFLLVGIVTQFMSDAATTAIFAPVAIALSTALHQAPEAYVVTVAMASVAAFFTPIGHHGNLLVYGPGRYQFSDFVKVGTPLTLIVAVIVSFLAPLIWTH
ncbi:MAG: SLC13 family permease [Anaerolineae bacterium]